MTRPLRIGVAGLGRAFVLMRATLRADPRVQVVAAADPRPEARRRFEDEFGGRAYASVDALVGDAAPDAIYVATPHGLHAEHAIAAARAGKHVLVEKPMALTLADCDAMIGACAAAGVQLVVGPSHGFDAPVREARRIVDGGELGRVRMITAVNFTDFLYRLRRPEELDTAAGGGAVFNQAAHHVDVVRGLAGSPAVAVRALTGNWDPARPTEGAYAFLLTFEDGAFASVVYSGYAHFDSDELCGWTGEMGAPKDPDAYGAARRGLAGTAAPDAEAALKSATNYGGPTAAQNGAAAVQHPHFGMLVVSCEQGDLRPLPDGVIVYGNAERRRHPLLPPVVPRSEVIDELHDAVVLGRPPLHDGHWAKATLEVCLALLRSARERRDVPLVHQHPGAPAGAA